MLLTLTEVLFGAYLGFMTKFKWIRLIYEFDEADNSSNKKVLVDPKGDNFSKYSGFLRWHRRL